MRVIYTLYQDAPSLAQQGEQTVSTDRLITHQSEALVRWVAQLSGIDQDLGVRRESGSPASMASRTAFLSDPTHKVVFYYTPERSSWMNEGRNYSAN